MKYGVQNIINTALKLVQIKVVTYRLRPDFIM